MDLKVNKCCCMNLRTAGLLIAWLHLLIIIIVSCTVINRIIFLDKNPPPPPKFAVFRPIVSAITREIINLVIYLFNATLTSLLLFGIYKKKHLMMLPYIILNGLSVLLMVPYLGQLFITALYSDNSDIFEIIMGALLCAALFGLMAYCWIVIYSLYHKIRDSINKPMSRQFEI
ncbi:uncharacterized protein LOC129921132 [Episyrphus balteatus]|uniref:uncharacterized protein LOC129921132 n=1 Tax=Episyrphus balteatus TaxID=286459 RepID=UPI002485EA9D|nr:uncharacterized protein LOC129921132 [Episyrphus balteatus]